MRQAQEATILERAEEIKAEGESRRKLLMDAVPQVKRCRTHWDYVLEEMAWLANDFAQERLWKRAAAAQLAHLSARCEGVAGLQRRQQWKAQQKQQQPPPPSQQQEQQTQEGAAKSATDDASAMDVDEKASAAATATAAVASGATAVEPSATTTAEAKPKGDGKTATKTEAADGGKAPEKKDAAPVAAPAATAAAAAKGTPSETAVGGEGVANATETAKGGDVEMEDWWLEGTSSPISPLCFSVEMEEVMKILHLVEEEHNTVVRKAENQLREVEEAMRRSVLEPMSFAKGDMLHLQDSDLAWEPTAEELAALPDGLKAKKKRPKKVSAKSLAAAEGEAGKIGEDGQPKEKPMTAAELKRLRTQQRAEAKAAEKAAKKAALLAAKAAAAANADMMEGHKGKKKKMAETLAEAIATGLPRRSHKAGGGEVNRKNQQAHADRQAAATGQLPGAHLQDPSGSSPQGITTEGPGKKKSQRNRAAEKARRQAKAAAAAAGLSVPVPVPAPWSSSEDKVLCAIVHEFGSNWGLVSDVIYSNRCEQYERTLLHRYFVAR